MPGFLTDRANNMVLDCLFGGVPLAPPGRLYVGLSLCRAFKGGHVVEPQAGSYARAEIVNDPAQFPAASMGRKFNAAAICFPAPLESWGAVRSVFVADAPVGGIVYAMADLPEERIIAGGDRAPRLDIDALSFSHF